MKNKVLNILMIVATVPLIILLILGCMYRSFIPAVMIGMPFMLLGVGTLYIKNKFSKKEVI